MSGSSANAAARRRRGLTAANPTPNYTTQDNDKNQKIQQSQPPSVPNLTVPQTLMYLDSRLSKIEHKLSSSTDSMLDINGNIDVSLLPQKLGTLEKNLNTMEQQMNTLEKNITENVITRLNGFANTISSLETKIENIPNNMNENNEDKVLKEEFNTILSDVGNDIGTLTEQVTGLKDLVLNVQNTNILLNSTIIQLSNDCRTKNIENDSTIAIADENEEQTDIQEDDQTDIEDEEQRIELKINEKEKSIKEEVELIVNEDLIEKLKKLNSISSETGTVSVEI